MNTNCQTFPNFVLENNKRHPSDNCWGRRIAKSQPIIVLVNRCCLYKIAVDSALANRSKKKQTNKYFLKKLGCLQIKKYTEIDVQPDDCLPQIICRNCQRVIINIEESTRKMSARRNNSKTMHRRKRSREQVTVGEIATAPKKDTVHFPRYIRHYFLSSTRRPCDVLWWP